ncbi:MAG: glycosyltransferase, partial [Proteobacteria bacterium]|nr:glycosyltransferase [Pseudomonadota bacterium]
MKLTVLQVLPALQSGGVERGTIEVAAELIRRGHRAVVVSAGGRMEDELLETGAEHVTLPVGQKSLLSLRYLAPLKSTIESTGADILHCRSRFPAWLGLIAWSLMPASRRPAFVTTVHGPYSVNAYSRVMVRGDRVIAISEFIRDYIREAYPDIPMDRV